MKKIALLAFALGALSVNKAHADLDNSLFGEIAREHGLPVNLLYSVALAESAYSSDKGISPWPYTLRTATKAYYAKTLAEAENILTELLRSARSVDVGIMQVNLYWNSDRIKDPKSLLSPENGLRMGASILSERIKSAPGDLELGIGRYHNIKEEALARNYGARVLAICKNISYGIGGDCE
ncbi:lytic transglycosylase domain-containing protein [Pseudomonas sp. LTJR-52]|uniref:transglycosylase SLT domain-containing protein n=1 Tax=Pseudomonas sp. LTJR-52 TaxID=2479392 RepID=UPI000EFD760D|nr:transglycosylase SLT domain-containing protein [Pseudomonas sp. LTJR-52]AYN96813.1 lytic transglycosylase domain-containing protein [Pseudomonas sp. LTJR-52]